MCKLRTVMVNLYHFRWRRVVNQLPQPLARSLKQGLFGPQKAGELRSRAGSQSVFHCFEAGANHKKNSRVFFHR